MNIYEGLIVLKCMFLTFHTKPITKLFCQCPDDKVVSIITAYFLCGSIMRFLRMYVLYLYLYLYLLSIHNKCIHIIYEKYYLQSVQKNTSKNLSNTYAIKCRTREFFVKVRHWSLIR